MELKLTGGVLFSLLCEIKKKPISKRDTRQGHTDPASEFEMIKALCEIAQGHSYRGNPDTLRSKLTKYKTCSCDGNDTIPLESRFEADGDSENVKHYLFNEPATRKRIAVFIDRFIDLENDGAIESFVDAVNDIIASDTSILYYCSENALVRIVTKNEQSVLSLDEYLFNVIYCVIASHEGNVEGREALTVLNDSQYYPKSFNMRVNAEPFSSELIEKYKKDLFEPVYAREGWEEYIKNLKIDYSNVRIYYDPDNEYPFYKVYVNTSLSNMDPFSKRADETHKRIYNDPTSRSITEFSRHIYVSGTGGLGKTMLMKHLLLESIENDVEHVPIFVSVKYYNDTYKDFYDFILAQCSKYDSNLTKEDLLKLISSHRCFLILDGFDELISRYKPDFYIKFNQFIRIDFENIIVMSSRPVEGSKPRHFITLYILPFKKLQSLELIDKLSTLANEKHIGEGLKKEIEKTLEITHKSYIENPLLLTLMLRIYEEYAMIPKEKYAFYHKAYEVLSHQHDARKEGGGYVREYKTGLSPSEFANVFKRFCAYSMILEGKTFFYELDFQEYFDLVKNKSDVGFGFTLEDFIHDATVSTGLMYHNLDRYEFIHRSMQEFFCAWYLSQQEDSLLYTLAMQLQSYGKGLVQEIFEMLDEMIPLKMEKYVYLPYLSDLFTGDKEHLHDNYKDFLCRLYNDIRYHHSEVDMAFEIEPSEAIYDLYMKSIHNQIIDIYLGLPEYDEFEEEEIVEFRNAYGKYAAGTRSDIPDDYDADKYGEPVVVGHFYSFKMTEVLSNPENYNEITDIIFDNDFPLRREYEWAKEYWEQMRIKYSNDKTTTDIKALLT